MPRAAQPLQPPGNSKTLRQHTGFPAFFGFKGGHDVLVWVPLASPGLPVYPSPSLPSVESALHSTSAIFRMATGWNDVLR
jgi:hypothetical protein